MKSLDLREAAGNRLMADDVNGPADVERVLRELGVEDPEVLIASDAGGLFVGGVIAGAILAEQRGEVEDAEVVD